MAHVGDELRLVLAGDLKFLDRAGKVARARLYFFEQTCVLNSDHCLVGEGRGELNLLLAERLYYTAHQDDRTTRKTFAQKRDAQERPIASSTLWVAKGVLRIS